MLASTHRRLFVTRISRLKSIDNWHLLLVIANQKSISTNTHTKDKIQRPQYFQHACQKIKWRISFFRHSFQASRLVPLEACTLKERCELKLSSAFRPYTPCITYLDKDFTYHSIRHFSLQANEKRVLVFLDIHFP